MRPHVTAARKRSPANNACSPDKPAFEIQRLSIVVPTLVRSLLFMFTPLVLGAECWTSVDQPLALPVKPDIADMHIPGGGST